MDCCCVEWLIQSMTEIIIIINLKLIGSHNVYIFICWWNSVPGGHPKVGLCGFLDWNIGQLPRWPEVRGGFSIEFLLWLRPCSRRLCCQLIYEVSSRQTPCEDGRTRLLVQCHSVWICQVIISMDSWSVACRPPRPMKMIMMRRKLLTLVDHHQIYK